ncbi:MAG: GntR family transcriptional regulator [Oceanobacter sp.]
MSSTAEKKLVGQSALEAIRNDIISGDLTPGSKLKLNALQQRYGVSVNTLRETLMRLVSEDFVEFKDQKGFRVKQVSLQDLEELIELRSTMEILGLKKAMARKTDLMNWKSQLISAHYRLSCAQLKMLSDDSARDEWLNADRAFHMVIVAGSGSTQLIRHHGIILELFMRYQLLALQTHPFRGQAVIDEHKELLDRMLEDDLDGAIECLTSHINKGGELPTSTLKSA